MIYQGDCIDILPTLEANTIQCCVTSPPYWGLRDYGVDGQIGLEETPDAYVARLVEVFREVRRVLKDDGTLWLNLGDSYFSSTKGTGGSDPKTSPKQAWKGATNGQSFNTIRISAGHLPIKPKDLIGTPWRVAFALQADGWYLRQDIIWAKPNPMPESVTDRCTKSHEYIFLLSKSARYYYDAEAIREPVKDTSGKNMRAPKLGEHRKDGNYDTVTAKTYAEIKGANRRSVWTIITKPFKGAHFATFPPEIPEICIKAGSKPGDTILDPFSGAGTTGVVAEKFDRKYIGIELNPQYTKLAEDRIYNVQPLFAGVNA